MGSIPPKMVVSKIKRAIPISLPLFGAGSYPLDEVIYMARRRTRTRYRTRVKRVYSRRKGLFSKSKLMNVAWGAGAGFVDPMIPNFLGKWTKPLIYGAGGVILNKPALLTVAGYKLGEAFTVGSVQKIVSGFWE